MIISVLPISDDPLHEYTGAAGCAEIFIDQMNGLYLLAFLVTADMQITDKCFSKALDEYLHNSCGFMDWAKHDGRRAVLRHAVQIIQPVPKRASGGAFLRNALTLRSAGHQPFAAISSLCAFERFVFVMSVIEDLSEAECAALLNCSVEDVTVGRELAREIIAVEDIGFDLTGEMDLVFVPSLLASQRCGVC